MQPLCEYLDTNFTASDPDDKTKYKGEIVKVI